jgi:hypothetical protein
VVLVVGVVVQVVLEARRRRQRQVKQVVPNRHVLGARKQRTRLQRVAAPVRRPPASSAFAAAATGVVMTGVFGVLIIRRNRDGLVLWRMWWRTQRWCGSGKRWSSIVQRQWWQR